jgi:translation initiation factor 1
MAKEHSRLVYSTDKGKLCPVCHNGLSNCQCAALASARPLGDGKVRIRRDTKGRKGKGVTLIEGLPLNISELEAMAKLLKTRCGSGGAVKDGVIEIQGDHRPAIIEFLKSKNYDARLAGG